MTILDVAIELLQRADSPGDLPKVVVGEEVNGWPQSTVEVLTEFGLLAPMGLAQRWSCNECDEVHSEPVNFPEAGTPYIYCPAAGRVEVSLASLQRWSVSIRTLASTLCNLLETGRTPREVLKGRDWALGASKQASGLEIHLLRGASWPDALGVFASVTRRTGVLSVILSEEVPAWMLNGTNLSLASCLHERAGQVTIVLPAPELLQKPTNEGEFALRRTGQDWTVTWLGEVRTIRHYVGLVYLADLLRNPGQDIGALQLLALSGSARDALLRPADDLSMVTSSEDVLDKSARLAYQERIAELDARKRSGLLAGEEQAELSYLQDELRRQIGLGGRSRKLQGPTEKARTSVSKALDRVENRLVEILPGLAVHLKRSISRGATFSYQPESPISWKVTTSL